MNTFAMIAAPPANLTDHDVTELFLRSVIHTIERVYGETSVGNRAIGPAVRDWFQSLPPDVRRATLHDEPLDIAAEVLAASPHRSDATIRPRKPDRYRAALDAAYKEWLPWQAKRHKPRRAHA